MSFHGERHPQYAHGHATKKDGQRFRSPTYNSWRAMLTRCENRNNWQFPDYGGKGTTVCERWHVFAEFLADMGERPTGTFIERRDNSKGYEPSNCRWASRTEQNRNRSSTRMDWATVCEIRRRRNAGEIYRTIAADFSISIPHAQQIAKGKIWKTETGAEPPAKPRQEVLL